MRALGTSVLLAVLTGCATTGDGGRPGRGDPQAQDPEDVPLEEAGSRVSYQGTLPYATPGGVAMDPNHLGAFGIMDFGACEITWFGAGFDLGYEYDFPGEDGDVDDEDEDGDVILISRVGVVRLLPFAPGYRQTLEVTETDRPAVGARLTDDGFVALTTSDGDCAVEWWAEAQTARTTWAGACPASESFAVDPATGEAFVALPDATLRVSPDGVDDYSSGADLAVFDGATGAVYLTTRGTDELRAIEPDGSERWTVTLEGAVSSLDDLGSAEGVAVVVSLPTGEGALLLLDAATGAVTDRLALPRGEGLVTSAPDGTRLAIRRPFQLHFFGVAQ